MGKKHLNSNKNDLKWRMNLCFMSFCGRSGEAQTRGLRIPNAARYQLRYTPIVIKLWSCKWSNLWSNTVLTAFYHFPNRPKSARLKGFRRFSLSYGENTVYAPKCRALPTAPHPDKIFIFLKMQYRNKFVVKVEELSSMRFIRYCLYYSKIGGKCQLRKGNNVDLIQFTYKYRIYLFVI